MSSHSQDEPVTEIDFDVTLDIRSLRARVEVDVPSLVLSDGSATVQISTGLGGPSVRDLIPVGRLVASALRFQTVCNRFTRANQQPVSSDGGSTAEGATGEVP